MTMSAFSKMKKTKPDYDKMIDNLSQEKKDYNDDRFWKYKADEKGGYYGEIRFLPTSLDGNTPIVKTFNHFFQSEIGKWYIDECPTTVEGGECPVCKANGDYLEPFGGWKEAPKEAKDFVSNRKRHTGFISNIYVVSDPANPENEGKVFLFKYGVKIHEKIMSAIKPKFEDEVAIDPFDFWNGATFKLKVQKVNGETNYDSSGFSIASKLLSKDADMEAVFNSQYDLKPFVDPTTFSSYEDLETKLNRVMGTKKEKVKSASDIVQESRTIDEPVDNLYTDEEIPMTASDGDDGDPMSYFDNVDES